MNDKRNHEQWREAGWRPHPSPADEARLRAWLAAHPEDRAEALVEEALNRALGRLPDAPMPGNFTARVLQAAQLAAAQAARAPRPPWLGWRLRFPWLPKSAVVVILVGASVLSYHQVLAFQRAQLARSLVAISDVASLPSPQILTNFEVIRVIERTPPPDVELLQLLK
jgi:anti-sigma factor RsiW